MKEGRWQQKKRCKAIIALEDGRVFEGKAFGARGERYGELVFNTSMTGYQEILTDPSYKGQIVTMTYPLIGNYGVNPEDVESARPHVEGFVVGSTSGTTATGGPKRAWRHTCSGTILSAWKGSIPGPSPATSAQSGR